MASPAPSPVAEAGWKLALRGAVRLGLVCALCALALRAGWTRGAWLLGLFVATVLVNLALLAVLNPAVLRARIARARIEHAQERRFAIVSFSSMLALLAIGALDARFGWSNLGPASLRAGIALHLLGDLPLLWTMAANPWLDRTVRIQSERAQRVVRSGPYRVVRHPMYFSLLLMEAGWPLILGSLWAFVPWAVLAVALVRRVRFEEDLLRRELEGYAEYMQQTRFRIVPGVW
jgi:protein-S-isoprenylcysteine O-methyltransferase Ste14